MKPPYESEDEVARITEGLLRSFREDVAPARAKKATLAALGLVGTTAGAVTVSASAGAASAWTGVAKVGALAIVKALAGGAIVGAVVVGTSSYLQTKSALKPPAVNVASLPAAPMREETSPRASGPAVEPVSEPAPEGPAPKPVPTVRQDPNRGSAVTATSDVTEAVGAAAPAAAPTAPTARASSLAREIALLDQARAALAAGETREALRILDGYAATVGRGALEPEAVVLRIDALVRSHEMGAARRLAEEFERLHPNDGHLVRIHSLLRGSP